MRFEQIKGAAPQGVFGGLNDRIFVVMSTCLQHLIGEVEIGKIIREVL